MERSLRHRAPLLWLAVPMLAGLALGRWGLRPDVSWLLGAALTGVLLALPASRNPSPRLWTGLILISMVLAGLAAYRLAAGRLGEWETLPEREVRLGLRCERLFSSRAPDRCSGLAKIEWVPGHLRELAGRRLYFNLGSEALPGPLLRGVLFDAKGVLCSLPAQPEPRSFDSYLFDSGIQFRLSRGRIVLLLEEAGPWSRFCGKLLNAMERLLAYKVKEKNPAASGAFTAMMLGQLGELSEDQNKLFRESGTMHLFSISGMHIAVIALAFHTLFRLLGLHDGITLIVKLALLWTYVDATGASPSAVRAFLMVAMVEIAHTLRQPFNALTGLVVSGLSVMIVSPCQVFGASFQMSYGIVAALVLFAGPLSERVLAHWEPFRLLPVVSWCRLHHIMVGSWRWGVRALAAGVGASLVGTLTGLHYFGLMTPGALWVNLALIPASGLVMLSGLVSLGAGFVLGGAGATLTNHGGCLVLVLMEEFVRQAMHVPGMCFGGEFRQAWLGGASLCSVLALCLWGYGTKWRGWPLAFLLPCAFVLLLLLAGVRPIPLP